MNDLNGEADLHATGRMQAAIRAAAALFHSLPFDIVYRDESPRQRPDKITMQPCRCQGSY